MSRRGDQEHWSVVAELERKTVHALARISNDLVSGRITRTEARSAYEMVLWMSSGLVDDEELASAITEEIRALKESPQLGMFVNGEHRVIAVANGDRYKVFKLDKAFNYVAPQESLYDGYGYARVKLINAGFKEL